MALFVEVTSKEKGNIPVIINLEMIVEIAPLVEGGCALFFQDGAAVGGVRSMKVAEEYSLFKQFVMQTVSTEDVAKKVKSLKAAANVTTEMEIPKL